MINDINATGQTIDSLMPSASEKRMESGFGDMLAKAVEQVNARYAEADQAAADLATGRSGDVHQTMIAMEKADVSFRLLMQVRNKVVSAYENIMRMQI